MLPIATSEALKPLGVLLSTRCVASLFAFLSSHGVQFSSPTSPKTSPRPGSRLVGASRMSVMTRSEQEIKADAVVVQEEAIWKKPDDSLQPCVCVMDGTGLIVRDAAGEVLAKVRYDEIRGVTMRARPLHCDVYYGNGDRYRLCSWQLQGIVNELSLRSRGRIKVEFEPNALPFEHGNLALRKRMGPATATVSNDAVQRGFAIQDAQLDVVEGAAVRLQHMALDIGEEVEDSTRQIKSLGKHADHVQDRLAATNNRVVRILDK